MFLAKDPSLTLRVTIQSKPTYIRCSALSQDLLAEEDFSILRDLCAVDVAISPVNPGKWLRVFFVGWAFLPV